MENASKALIIAGAILLSILIIGLGMAVYNNASSTTGKANLDPQEISAHNSQFLAYEGKQKGSNIRTLVNAIRTNNRDYTDRMIKITNNMANVAAAKVTSVDGTPTSVSEDPNSDYDGIINAIKNNTTYYVTFGYGDNGCINGVEIHIWSQVD